MQRARRLYLYFVSAVSLLAIGVGISRLLMNLFERISDALRRTDLISGDADAFRREASLVIAIIVVALPIWLLHWWLAERAVAGTDTQAETERSSTERALYLAVVLLVTFVIFLTSSISFVRELIRDLASDDARTSPGTIPDSLALMMTTAAVWLYHSHVRRRDEQHGAGLAKSAALPRFSLYAALVVAAIVALTSLSDLLSLAAQAIFDERPVLTDTHWWVDGLAAGVAGSLVGLALWAMQMLRASRLIARPDALGVAERRSVLRRFALYALTFIGLIVSLVFAAESLEQVVREILGASDGPENISFRIVEPLLRAIPFAAAWFMFGQLVVAEADESSEAVDQANVRRIYSYGIALIGLAAGSIGLASTLATAFDRLAGRQASLVGSGPWKDELSAMLPVALLGAATWIWQSYRFGQWVEDDPLVERSNTVRRVYVYTALAGAVVAVLVSLALIIYRTLSALLDVGTESLGRALSIPGGVFLVSAAVLIYHALILRADLAAQSVEETAAQRVILELSGPGDLKIDDILEQLARELPDGYRLRVLDRATDEPLPEGKLPEIEQRVSERD